MIIYRSYIALFHLSMLKALYNDCYYPCIMAASLERTTGIQIFTAGWTGGVFQSGPDPGHEPTTFRTIVCMLNHSATVPPIMILDK